MIHNKKILITARYLLLVLFIGYYTSISCFYHSHIFQGEIVSHSHPFRHDPGNKSPFEKHQHTSYSLQLIQKLNNTVWSNDLSLKNLPDLFTFGSTIGAETVSNQIILQSVSSAKLRGPPIS